MMISAIGSMGIFTKIFAARSMADTTVTTISQARMFFSLENQEYIFNH